MKDYYKILKLHPFEKDQEVILKSYKERNFEILNSNLIKDQIKIRLLDINEAYLVLSNSDIKRVYDNSLTTNVWNENVKDLIYNCRAQAEQFVRSKEEELPQRAKSKRWKLISRWIGGGLLALLVIAFLVGFFIKVFPPTSATIPIPVEEIKVAPIPSSWIEYDNRDFKLSLPPFFEKQVLEINSLNQNKNISKGSTFFIANDNLDIRYREDVALLVHYDNFTSEEGVGVKYNEHLDFTEEEKVEVIRVFKESMFESSGNIGEITFGDFLWVKFDNTYALSIPCMWDLGEKRFEFKLYFLYNWKSVFMFCFIYPEDIPNDIKNEFMQIVTSFKWNNPID